MWTPTVRTALFWPYINVKWRKKMNKYLPLIISGVLLNAFAQMSLKIGMRAIGTFSFTPGNIIPIGMKVIINPFIVAGLGCYVVSVVVWLLALSRVEVTYAYPLLSIGYIVTAICGHFFLGENMDVIRWLGVLVICGGVFLITRTA